MNAMGGATAVTPRRIKLRGGLFPPTMTETELLSTLVGEIYDAALDATLWRPTLAKAARFVGGYAASLFTKSASSLTGTNVYDSGIEARVADSYFTNYIKLDPLVMGHVFAEIGRPTAVSDLMPYGEFVQSRFYEEWAKPQGFVDFAGAVLDKSSGRAAMFGVFRHEQDGEVDEATRQRMQLVVPHVRRAALVAGVIDQKSATAANLAESLDGLACGLFLVDASGRILHANIAGRRMLDAGDFLRIANGRLAAGEPATDSELSQIIAATAGGDRALGAKGIALPLSSRDGQRYLAHALPLASDARRSAGGSAATLAIFVHSAAVETPAMPEVIARAYDLTLAELRVLLAIADIGGAPEVADALGIATSTVKTHLGRLYEKTGARRQADLAKLVAGYVTPLLR